MPYPWHQASMSFHIGNGILRLGIINGSFRFSSRSQPLSWGFLTGAQCLSQSPVAASRMTLSWPSWRAYPRQTTAWS
eukprot:scaffold219426_cov47-Prasinocladus_malaysianus.AAC.1